MSQIKNSGLDQYGAERFEQQQFETTGVEGVNFACPLWSFTLVSNEGSERHKRL